MLRPHAFVAIILEPCLTPRVDIPLLYMYRIVVVFRGGAIYAFLAVEWDL